MSNWTIKKLPECVSFKTGKLNSNAATSDGKYPFFTCSQEVYKTNAWAFDTECVLLGGNNASAIYPIFYYKGKFNAYQRTYVIESKQDNNIRYFYYLISNSLDELRKKSTGATTKFLTIKILNNINVSVPDPSTQTSIASALSAYDDLIENNNKRIKTLEEMVQLLYVEWFVKFKFPGHSKPRANRADTEVKVIPKGWAFQRIGDKFSVVLGGTPSRAKKSYWENGTVPWINSGKVNDLRIIDESELISEEALRKSATKLMPRRTTLLAITGATLGQVSLTEIECCANQSVVGVYDTEGFFNEYLYLKIKEIIKNIIALAGGGAQPHINKDIVMNTEILIPDVSLVKEFSSVSKGVFDEIASLMFQNKKLLKTRDLLLPQLVTGKRELKQSISVVTFKDGKSLLSPYQDAVTFALIVRDLAKKYGKSPSRFEVQKNKYFVDRFLMADIRTKYTAMTYGPYDKTSRYKGGEKVALKSNYISIEGDTKFKVGQKIGEAEKYYSRQLLKVEPVLAYVKNKSDVELEMLTTTDYAIFDLVSTHSKKVTAKDVLEYIGNHSVWKEKITRLSLTEEKIMQFMTTLKDLTALGIRYPQI